MNLKDIEDIKQLTVCHSISNAGTPQVPWVSPFFNLPFQADFCIIDQISVSTETANFNGNIFLITSDLIQGDVICTFSGNSNSQVSSGKIIALKRPTNQINFDIKMANTDGSLIAPVLGGNWYLSISMSFIKLRKYENSHKLLNYH